MATINTTAITETKTQTKQTIPNNSLSSVQDGLTSLTDLTKEINNYVLSPLQRLGFGGFEFDKVAGSEVGLSKEVTKHITEKGSTITDHIISKPKTISITGFVGEKVFELSPASKSILNKLTQKLPVILSAVPKLTTGMQQLKSVKDSFQKSETQNTINNSVDLFNTFKLLPKLLPLF